ncbi:MAG: hydroxyacylglutathione hydrolase [Geminicoccaceae bacterium]|nr:hydroxyacylglutathione hydrolase [Geminicoccaceae bacterium]MDW8370465.1 hydroxyacylglutathione hydrolase [Geminicoccaceae bacterium]
MTLSVEIVPLLADNYGYLLVDGRTGTTAFVDPAEAAPVVARVRARGGRLDWILLTHHHGDHVAGTAELVAAFGAKVAGAAADAHRLPPLDRALAEDDRFELGAASARVLATPGHTTGHVSYLFEESGDLFCGDTLFVMGCGRLIEGDAEAMWRSLAKLAALPPATRVWCGHEYTLANARFALSLDPENEALRARAVEVERLRMAGRPTVPSTIGEERATNPFLRAGEPAIRARMGTVGASAVEAFAAVRRAKDRFRG